MFHKEQSRPKFVFEIPELTRLLNQSTLNHNITFTVSNTVNCTNFDATSSALLSANRNESLFFNSKNICRLLKDMEDLRKKLAEEKKERNDKHVAHRNEMAILRAENEDLKRRVRPLHLFFSKH